MTERSQQTRSKFDQTLFDLSCILICERVRVCTKSRHERGELLEESGQSRCPSRSGLPQTSIFGGPVRPPGGGGGPTGLVGTAAGLFVVGAAAALTVVLTTGGLAVVAATIGGLAVVATTLLLLLAPQVPELE